MNSHRGLPKGLLGGHQKVCLHVSFAFDCHLTPVHEVEMVLESQEGGLWHLHPPGQPCGVHTTCHVDCISPYVEGQLASSYHSCCHLGRCIGGLWGEGWVGLSWLGGWGVVVGMLGWLGGWGVVVGRLDWVGLG